MAPLNERIPEEVNVYSIPHFRMKELVDKYFSMISKTNFEDIDAMENLLDTLVDTFREFKSHELIENKYIIKRLKFKMKCRQKDNSLVCKCHKESGLSEMLRLVKEGFKKTHSLEERITYGEKLLKELENFTQSFLPHMREEEEVFQPLLLEYFTYDELCQLKSFIIEQHKIKSKEFLLNNERHHSEEISDYSTSGSESDPECENLTNINNLPNELILVIFSYLAPKDLMRCSGVNRLWSSLVWDYTLWADLQPVAWTRGSWEIDKGEFDLYHHPYDEENTKLNNRESRIHNYILTYLSSKVGSKILSLNLSYSQVADDFLIKQYIFQFCNLRHLNLSNTKFSDVIFMRLNQVGLHLQLLSLDLSGCEQVTDESLKILSHFQMDVEDYLLIGQLNRYLVRDTCKSCCKNLSTNCNIRFQEPILKVDTSLVHYHYENNLSTLKEIKSNISYSDSWINKHTIGDYNWEKGKSKKINAINNEKSNEKDIQKYSLVNLNLSGCSAITDNGIQSFFGSGSFKQLQSLDLSGIIALSHHSFQLIYQKCPQLDVQRLFFCDNIFGTPFDETANGCNNIENENRFCCRNIKIRS